MNEDLTPAEAAENATGDRDHVENAVALGARLLRYGAQPDVFPRLRRWLMDECPEDAEGLAAMKPEFLAMYAELLAQFTEALPVLAEALAAGGAS